MNSKKGSVNKSHKNGSTTFVERSQFKNPNSKNILPYGNFYLNF